MEGKIYRFEKPIDVKKNDKYRRESRRPARNREHAQNRRPGKRGGKDFVEAFHAFFASFITYHRTPRRAIDFCFVRGNLQEDKREDRLWEDSNGVDVESEVS